jgi:hypothetical protein
VANAKVTAMRDEHKEDFGGMFLASVSRDRTVRLWMVFDGVCVKTIVSPTLLRSCCAPAVPFDLLYLRIALPRELKRD